MSGQAPSAEDLDNMEEQLKELLRAPLDYNDDYIGTIFRDLKPWYLKKKPKSHFSFTLTIITTVYSILFTIACVAGFLFLASLTGAADSLALPMTCFFFLLLLPSAIGTAHNLYWYYMVENERQNLLKENKQITKENFPEVYHTVLSIAHKAGINTTNLVILFSPQNHYIPSISDIRTFRAKQIILTLPRNLIAIAKPNNAHFSALVAHEFCHIIQNDTNLWMSEKFTRYNLANEWLRAFGMMGIFGLFYVMLKRLNDTRGTLQMRKKSELWADRGSIIFSESLSMLEVLRDPKYISPVGGPNHPSTADRIQDLRMFLYDHFVA